VCPHPCSTVCCVCLAHLPSRLRVTDIHIATIYFKEDLTAAAADKLVDALLAEDAPVLSCAGGLMIEHPLTQKYVDHIDGSEDSVMGLSKDTVLDLLQLLGEKLEEVEA